ncbi:hypothetical protein LIER_14460 [Lithospermum erythrorhizon]|uniref:Uncharacterized protein n=1 Tax=Lithospermum erythrorhizon TaxID=34254 RepID=A0AAV3Q3V3_LITER
MIEFVLMSYYLQVRVKLANAKEDVRESAEQQNSSKKMERIRMRGAGQIHPIAWLNVTIFQVACKIARIQATIPLFTSLFTSKHRPYDSSLAAKAGRRLTIVWEYVQRVVDPTKLEVAAMKGKRLPRFSSELVVRKPLAPGATLIHVFLQKRSSTIESSASVCKKAKIEALVVEESGAGKGKEKSKAPTSILFSKAILPLLSKTSTRSKKGKGKATTSGEEFSLNSYTAKYVRAPYILPNDLSIEDGHLWNNRMEAFHVALNANYAYTRREMLKEMSSEKMLEDLDAAQVSLKERDEELNSYKEALSDKEVKC